MRNQHNRANIVRRHFLQKIRKCLFMILKILGSFEKMLIIIVKQWKKVEDMGEGLW
ncbi:hypothetical protein ROSEINA2194_02219 [Roseburia inulinivorans DSM 16841]|uniref:Uncharacterized protein n=1 Tax=Roseburia inulinivorans DSM 16841 TaxID=622312 RepID=C0FTZ8_9FIRM|nr:hypothetical protein ROSEINA2194_02219 [Roseburia inulinivorans DSM 16841]